MDNYWRYWKKGWWAQLIMLLFNVVLLIAVLPVAMFFLNNETAYYSIVTIIFVFILVPFGGWLFSYFTGKFNVQ